MNVSPDNVPGMGAITFPVDGKFGSGDIPVGLGLHKYANYINLLNLKKDDDDDEEEENVTNEESMMDKIGSSDNNRTPERQHADYAKAERDKFNEWKKKRKAYFIEKLKDVEVPEEKQLLKNQFKLETLKKKRQLSEKLKKKRVSKSKKNLNN